MAKDSNLLHQCRRFRLPLLRNMGHLYHQTVDLQRLLAGTMPANAIVVAVAVHCGHGRQRLQTQDDIPIADVAGMNDVLHISEQAEYGLRQFAMGI